MTPRQVFEKEFEALKADLIAEYKSKGMKASGQFERELEVFTSDTMGELTGMMYADQLEFGRKPTSGRGDGSLLGAIEQWIVDKGIAAQADIPQSSLAFLITRKIHREGWNREGFGGVELISTVVTEKRIEAILDKLDFSFAGLFVDRLEKELAELEISAR